MLRLLPGQRPKAHATRPASAEACAAATIDQVGVGWRGLGGFAPKQHPITPKQAQHGSQATSRAVPPQHRADATRGMAGEGQGEARWGSTWNAPPRATPLYLGPFGLEWGFGGGGPLALLGRGLETACATIHLRPEDARSLGGFVNHIRRMFRKPLFPDRWEVCPLRAPSPGFMRTSFHLPPVLGKRTLALPRNN